MFKDIVAQHGTLKAFGMDLSKSAQNVKGTFVHALPFFVLLLIMVGTQYYQQRQLTSRNPQANQGQQAQIMKFFPLLFGVLSIRFPAGVVLYWTLSNMIRIFQQWAMYRWDPKVKALVVADVKEVEARTRDIESKPPASRPRLRDLLSGPTPPPKGNDPKAGGRPGVSKPGSGKPSGGKPSGPASGRPSSPASGRPSNPAGGKTSGPASGRAGNPQTSKASPNGGAKGRPAATPPTSKASPNGGSTNGAALTPPKADPGPVGPGTTPAPKDEEPTKPPAPPATNRGDTGASRGRTGGGSARGNRKPPRRGR
jgi:hypothetical protein